MAILRVDGALLAFFCFLITSTAVSATSVSYCDKGRTYPVKVTAVDIIPSQVVPGQPATFKLSANTDSPIASGKLVIDVKYFFFHVYEETHDICNETSCPVSVGDFTLAHQQTLPSITPPGSYTVTMKMLGEDDKELSCVSFGFSIGWLPSTLADF